MKIAILSDAYLTDESTGVNGTQVQLYQLAHAFAAHGHDVHYVCSTRSANAGQQLKDGAITLHYFPDRHGMFTWFSDLRDAGRQLGAIAPDAVYQRGRSPLTFAAALWAQRNAKPFVWGSNGEDSGEFFKYCTRLFRSRRGLLKKLVLLPDMWLCDLSVHRGLARANHVVSQTEHQRARLGINFGKDAIVLPSYYLAPAGDGPAAHERMVLWLANLSPGKQPEVFIDLVASLRDVAHWHFILAGGTPDPVFAESLRRRAATVPALDLAGPIPFAETARLFGRAALYVSTSRPDADGLPNAFIQAWLHGTPVLSLHHDPNGWIEQNALGYCAKGNTEAFVEKARQYLLDPTAIERLRPRCIDFARATFSNGSVIDKYVELFSQPRTLVK